jgi:uncharacterized membrane protein YvbJ
LKICPDCDTKNQDFNDSCSKCGADLKNKIYNSSSNGNFESSDKPSVCIVLFIMAWLSIIVGVIGCISVFTYDGIHLSAGAAILYLASGIISAVLFWAVSEIIKYLHIISQNSKVK